MTKTSKIVRLGTTDKGGRIQITVGHWQNPRTLFANKHCIMIEIKCGRCFDCDRCQTRKDGVESRLQQKGIPHLWSRGWLILANNYISTTTTFSSKGGKSVARCGVLDHLPEILGLKCTEVQPEVKREP